MSTLARRVTAVHRQRGGGVDEWRGARHGCILKTTRDTKQKQKRMSMKEEEELRTNVVEVYTSPASIGSKSFVYLLTCLLRNKGTKNEKNDRKR